MKFINHKWPEELRELCDVAERMGATVRLNKHIVISLPDGLGNVVLPKTPSDRRTMMNATAQFRRALAGQYRKAAA